MFGWETGWRELLEKDYPVIDMKATGEWLRYICKTKNVLVSHIQKGLGLASNQAIYAWFNGKTLPSLDNFCALGNILGMPMDEMLVISGREHPFLRNFDKTQKRLLVYSRKICGYY